MMKEERSLLIDALENSKSMLNKAWDHVLTNPKDAKYSEVIRKQGNAVFLRSNHDDESHRKSFQYYCKSVAFAPCGSQELGLAYANRSALLQHIGKYKECIKDVERAIRLTESHSIQVTLFCRKLQCLKNLQSPEFDISLTEVCGFIDRINCSKSNKEQFREMVKTTVLDPVHYKVEQISKDKTINLPATSSILNNVSIQHNKRYGRHLLAAKKYKPGDTIFVENLYAIVVQPKDQYTNCHHCMKVCWSGVPCNQCNWAMFCSEDCYKECYNNYHDIECSLVTFLNSMNISWPISCLSIKILIKALKNAGSISTLKTQLNYVDQFLDICYKGFDNNGKSLISSIQSIYSLESKKLSETEKMQILEFVLNSLVGIIRHTYLMKNSNKSSIESLMEEDLVFLGCLLIRIASIIMNNRFEISPFFGMEDIARGISEDSRGIGLAPLASLINHSCNPNAKVCFTESGNIIVFAAHPIKKNSQIFISYCKEYYNDPLEDRQTMLKYNFVCSCQACLEAWSPELVNLRIMQEKIIQLEDPDRIIFRTMEQTYLHSTDPERKLLLSGSTILKSTDNYSYTLIEKVENLSKKVIAASKDTRKPSVILSLFLEALYGSITNLYNGLKPQSFGKCGNSRR